MDTHLTSGTAILQHMQLLKETITASYETKLKNLENKVDNLEDKVANVQDRADNLEEQVADLEYELLYHRLRESGILCCPCCCFHGCGRHLIYYFNWSSCC